MTLGRNLLAGLANSIWSAVIGLAVVPFYLKYLGIEAYGLIGFFVTTQALLQLLDMGMAPTINREVARCSASGNLKEAGKLLHTLAVVYWSMAAAIAVLIMALAPLIAEYWLQSKQLSSNTISHAVMLMGLVVACRWPVGLYQGALIGAQRLTVSSGINMVMVTTSSLGAVLILAFVSPTVEAFFVWQAAVGFVYTIAMRTAAWRIIGVTEPIIFDVGCIKTIWKFSFGVAAISFSGLMLTQVDKIILSKTLGLDNYGEYMVATMVASSLYMLIIPVFNTVYPKFSSLAAQGKTQELFLQYRAITHSLAALLFPVAMTLVIISKPLIQIWTSSDILANNIAPLVSFLLVAYALHGMMHIPYALMLAYGETRSMFSIYIVLIVVIVPLTATLSLMFGAKGGALAQLCLFVLHVPLLTWKAHKKYFNGYVGLWLFNDLGVPLSICFAIGIFGYFVIPFFENVFYVKYILALVLWLVATMLSISVSKLLRSIIFEYWNKFVFR